MKLNLPSLDKIQTVHIIGVCGTLMGSFAAFLKRQGIRVTGSDQNIYPPMSDVLQKAGVELLTGYRAENLEHTGSRPDLVVIGNVIGATNLEARAAIDQGYVYSSLPEAMEFLFLKETRNLVVAGTHGKTTTSSLLAHVLCVAQKDPNYFIGGVPQDLPFSFHIAGLGGEGQEKYFVLEGDEYDTAFWDKVPKFNHYLPDDVILTSVEFDHADIYADLNAVLRAFEGLVARVRPGGKLISCFDYSNVKNLVEGAKVPILSYGSSPESGARFYPGKIRYEEGTTSFEILDQGTQVDEVTIQMPGLHNVMNALAVWIETRELGLNPLVVQNAFKSFRGVKRRQEVRGEIGGVLIIDDFAHHPTAVRETLRALRLKYPRRRLLTVFEPRSATSRRKIFQKDYILAFQEADLTFIASPFDQAKIPPADQFSSATLVDDLKHLSKEAYLMNAVDEGVVEVAKQAQSGDLIAVLSNGGFDGFIPKLINLLPKR